MYDVEAPENVAEIKIPVPWGHISGKWWGSDEKQPLVAIHGWQDNAGTFDLLIPLLPKSHSYLCIDLPGHGLSSHLPQGTPYYLLSEGVLCIRRIVKHYGWKTISLIGHSFGAVICFFYAATYPSETELLIAIDSIQPALIVDEIAYSTAEAVDKFLEYDSMPQEVVPQYDYAEAVNIMKHQYHIPENACHALLHRGLEKTPTGKYIFSRDVRLKVFHFGNVSLSVAMKLATKVECRYLHIKPVPGHSFDTYHINESILKVIRSAAKEFKCIKVKGPHHVHLSNPDHLADIMKRFIE